MYNNMAQLLQAAQTQALPQVILADEQELTGLSQQQILEKFRDRWQVMCHSATRALTQPQEMIGGLIRGQASAQNTWAKGGKTLCGESFNSMMAMALSGSEVNAAMGRICAAPTAGACGILPAVLAAAAQRLQASEEQIMEALVVATGVGAVITKNATVSGAEGGCQAECGTAAAMAAAGAVWMAGGTAEQCVNACAIALMNSMGLVCDPVAGLVQLPCSFRNASQSANALASADLALAGQQSVIPADEVIDSMYRVGRQLPAALRETAKGGIAATPTGRKIHDQIFGHSSDPQE